MDLRQLRQFVVICEAGSLTGAAKRLHVAQQSLSSTLATLEADLGVQLLERGRFGVRVTAAGRVLCEGAVRLLGDADALARAAQQAAELGPGAVTIRYGLDAEHLVAPIMTAVREGAPELVITGWTAPDADNLPAVRDGRADLAFVWALAGHGDDVTTLTVGHETCVAAVPDTHPLADRAEIPTDALAGRTLVVFPRAAAPAVFDHITGHFAVDGRLLPRLHEAAVSGQAGMVDLAVDIHGIAPVSASLTPSLRRADVRFLPFRPPLLVPLQLAWPTRVSRATARFIDIVQGGTRQTETVLDKPTVARSR